MSNIKIKFSYVVLGVSLAVASCAAYFSVWGLSQLFAGASTAIIIMASILEFAKIVTTTALHKYWNKLTNTVKIYLTMSVIVLMMITSAGIYGFLSNAYQKTANKLEIHEGELGVLDGKKKIFEDAVLANNKIIDSKNKRIDQLSGLRSNQESRIDAAKSNSNANTLRNDISSSNQEIQKLSGEIDVLNGKNSVLNDSISKYQTKGLEVKSKSDVAGEVGPLKYIAGLTGLKMDVVVNYMILLLIIVFDPLAIALIIITNRIFDIEREEASKPEVKPVVEKQEEVEEEEVDWSELENSELDKPFELIDEGYPKTESEYIEGPKIGENSQLIEPEIIPSIEEIEIIEELKEEPKEEPKVEQVKQKLTVEEIREGNAHRLERGFSKKIPSNSVDRIGTNKILKNGDNGKIFYKKN